MPFFIHPAPPVTSDAMKRVQMPLPLYGFIIDTTMAITGLIFTGVLEKLPKLKFIHGHLGGVFPYMVGRINDCFHTYAADHGYYPLPKEPTEYYREQVWDDAISFHLPAMKCALEFMGADLFSSVRTMPIPSAAGQGGTVCQRPWPQPGDNEKNLLQKCDEAFQYRSLVVPGNTLFCKAARSRRVGPLFFSFNTTGATGDGTCRSPARFSPLWRPVIEPWRRHRPEPKRIVSDFHGGY